MPTQRDNAQAKMEQARHSLQLMERVLESQTPIVPGYTAQQEFAYFLSAFMNACFSATCMFDEDDERNLLMKAFRNAHHDFYRHGTGYRHADTHVEPLRPQERETPPYEPPDGNSVNFTLREQIITPAWNEVNFSFRDRDWYFPGQSERTIMEHCSDHWSELKHHITDSFP